MNKRTKFELIIFAIVAAFFLYTQISGIGGNGDVSSNPSSIETELKSSDTKSQEESAELSGSDNDTFETIKDTTSLDADVKVSEDGVYTDKDQVALYIASYGHLPKNYITKKEAKAAGWVSSEGNLDEICPGMSIGGDRFGNREGKLPEKENRKYYECDINYDKNDEYRGSERIIYSNDGLIYYTGDHYNTFELLYGEP